MDLEGFYAGDRAVLTAVYRRHVARVERAVSRYCRGADAECVIHDVFLKVIERSEVRRQFTGGDLGAWLATIAARSAVDFLRRRRRWTLLDDPRSIEGQLEPVESFFSPMQGGVLCPACGKGRRDAHSLSLAAFKVLRYGQTHDWNQFRRLRLTQALHAEVENVLYHYLLFILERNLKSVEFLRQLRREAMVT